MKYLLILLSIFIGLQFFQIPKPSLSSTPETDITNHVEVPENVHNILRKACYDCHSEETRYPWYSYIQPVGWWLKDHMDHGLSHLNFSDFGSYELDKAAHKMEEINDEVHEGEMPLESYTWIHGDARLSSKERKTLTKWAIRTYAKMEGVQ
jgi:hypothetical protein